VFQTPASEAGAVDAGFPAACREIRLIGRYRFEENVTGWSIGLGISLWGKEALESGLFS